MELPLITVLETLMKFTMLVMMGLYFTFSNTVMRALSQQSTGAEVMIEINKVILNPIFMLMFFGSAIASFYFFIVKDGVLAYAALVFFIGTTMITVIKNVPLNNKLLLAEEGLSRKAIWSDYLQKWVFWNHVRTISSMLATLFILL